MFRYNLHLAGGCVGYHGEWRFGRRHGKGIEFYREGGMYEGLFENGLKHGDGVIKHNDGREIKGQWIMGEYQNKLDDEGMIICILFF